MPEELSPAKKGNRFLGERISKVEDFVKDYLSVQDASAISHAEEPRQNGLSKFDTPTTHSDDAEWLTVQAPPTSAEVRKLPVNIENIPKFTLRILLESHHLSHQAREVYQAELKPKQPSNICLQPYQPKRMSKSFSENALERRVTPS
jgi:hypothetical protein